MTARDDDLDDPFIARYADRIDDATEVLWRADFDRAIDFEDRGFDEDASLLPRAREIRARWAADPVVGPSWSDLDEIHDGWIQAPEAMKRAHEVFMPGGLRPPGMSDTRWSSHMQAREMTGHGAWPGFEPTYSTDVSERHEPMTDTTDRDSVDAHHEQEAVDRDGWPVLSPGETLANCSAASASDQVRYSPDNPVPSFGTSVAARTNALAGYTAQGNALAAAMERQSERAGAER